MRCLCCNKEIIGKNKYELEYGWHSSCIKKFFGRKILPEIDLHEEKIEELANESVNKRLTVPGVQKKLSLHLEDEDRTSKLTLVDYPTGYILKPQSDEYEYLPESEFMVMKLAETAGISVVPCALMRVDGRYAYITKRIDREKNKMYAMEDFCQLSGRPTAEKYRSSYEYCGKIIKKYANNIGIDRTEFFYRLIFCFVTGNSDMHLKNFSLIEKSPGERIFSLSPAYDLLPVNIILPEDTEQMALSLNGKKKNIRKKDFYELAENLGISSKVAEGLVKQVLSYRDKFSDIIEEAYISDDMKNDMISLMNARMGVFEGR